MQHRYILLICLLIFADGMVSAAEEKGQVFSYDDYAVVLKEYADAAGMVNYKKLKTHREKLDTFVDTMDKLDPNIYSKWNNEEKIAFWLNAYNAFTLKVIIENYPIKASVLTSIYYPKNSIRQIPGVWDKIAFKVMGRDYTLANIEHKILRREFAEPRIHMAMVCAAMGCPVLRDEPYIGERLGEQLDDQSRKFLAEATNFKFNPEKQVLHISSIFKWFGKDFIKAYAKAKPDKRYSVKDQAILEFVSTYLDKGHAFFRPLKKTVKVKYLHYDWSLNEQKNGK